MQKRSHSPANNECVAARWSTEKRTRAGSSDTDANELIVMPAFAPLFDRAVTTATPVANCPRQSRKSRDENDILKNALADKTYWTCPAYRIRENGGKNLCCQTPCVSVLNPMLIILKVNMNQINTSAATLTLRLPGRLSIMRNLRLRRILGLVGTA